MAITQEFSRREFIVTALAVGGVRGTKP